MIMKLALLAGTLLQAALLGLACAADRKPDECGLASFYSSVSEATASGERTPRQKITPLLIGRCHSQLWSTSKIKKMGAGRW
jgi:hypothetical protein